MTDKKEKYPFEKRIVCGFTIKETIPQMGLKTIKTMTQKYVVGIYSVMYMNESVISQGGFENYKQMNKSFRNTIQKAFERGASIESVIYKDEEYYTKEN